MLRRDSERHGATEQRKIEFDCRSSKQIVSKAGKATATHADDVALATKSLEVLQGRDGGARHILWLFSHLAKRSALRNKGPVKEE